MRGRPLSSRQIAEQIVTTDWEGIAASHQVVLTSSYRSRIKERLQPWQTKHGDNVKLIGGHTHPYSRRDLGNVVTTLSNTLTMRSNARDKEVTGAHNRFINQLNEEGAKAKSEYTKARNALVDEANRALSEYERLTAERKYDEAKKAAERRNSILDQIDALVREYNAGVDARKAKADESEAQVKKAKSEINAERASDDALVSRIRSALEAFGKDPLFDMEALRSLVRQVKPDLDELVSRESGEKISLTEDEIIEALMYDRHGPSVGATKLSPADVETFLKQSREANGYSGTTAAGEVETLTWLIVGGEMKIVKISAKEEARDGKKVLVYGEPKTVEPTRVPVEVPAPPAPAFDPRTARPLTVTEDLWVQLSPDRKTQYLFEVREVEGRREARLREQRTYSERPEEVPPWSEGTQKRLAEAQAEAQARSIVGGLYSTFGVPPPQAVWRLITRAASAVRGWFAPKPIEVPAIPPPPRVPVRAPPAERPLDVIFREARVTDSAKQKTVTELVSKVREGTLTPDNALEAIRSEIGTEAFAAAADKIKLLIGTERATYLDERLKRLDKAINDLRDALNTIFSTAAKARAGDPEAIRRLPELLRKLEEAQLKRDPKWTQKLEQEMATLWEDALNQAWVVKENERLAEYFRQRPVPGREAPRFTSINELAQQIRKGIEGKEGRLTDEAWAARWQQVREEKLAEFRLRETVPRPSKQDVMARMLQVELQERINRRSEAFKELNKRRAEEKVHAPSTVEVAVLKNNAQNRLAGDVSPNELWNKRMSELLKEEAAFLERERSALQERIDRGEITESQVVETATARELLRDIQTIAALREQGVLKADDLIGYLTVAELLELNAAVEQGIRGIDEPIEVTAYRAITGLRAGRGKLIAKLEDVPNDVKALYFRRTAQHTEFTRMLGNREEFKQLVREEAEAQSEALMPRLEPIQRRIELLQRIKREGLKYEGDIDADIAKAMLEIKDLSKSVDTLRSDDATIADIIKAARPEAQTKLRDFYNAKEAPAEVKRTTEELAEYVLRSTARLEQLDLTDLGVQRSVLDSLRETRRAIRDLITGYRRTLSLEEIAVYEETIKEINRRILKAEELGKVPRIGKISITTWESTVESVIANREHSWLNSDYILDHLRAAETFGIDVKDIVSVERDKTGRIIGVRVRDLKDLQKLDALFEKVDARRAQVEEEYRKKGLPTPGSNFARDMVFKIYEEAQASLKSELKQLGLDPKNLALGTVAYYELLYRHNKDAFMQKLQDTKHRRSMERAYQEAGARDVYEQRTKEFKVPPPAKPAGQIFRETNQKYGIGTTRIFTGFDAMAYLGELTGRLVWRGIQGILNLIRPKPPIGVPLGVRRIAEEVPLPVVTVRDRIQTALAESTSFRGFITKVQTDISTGTFKLTKSEAEALKQIIRGSIKATLKERYYVEADVEAFVTEVSRRIIEPLIGKELDATALEDLYTSVTQAPVEKAPQIIAKENLEARVTAAETTAKVQETLDEKRRAAEEILYGTAEQPGVVAEIHQSGRTLDQLLADKGKAGDRDVQHLIKKRAQLEDRLNEAAQSAKAQGYEELYAVRERVRQIKNLDMILEAVANEETITRSIDFSKVTIIRKIGEGTTGRVWEVEYEGKRYALKEYFEYFNKMREEDFYIPETSATELAVYSALRGARGSVRLEGTARGSITHMLNLQRRAQEFGLTPEQLRAEIGMISASGRMLLLELVEGKTLETIFREQPRAVTPEFLTSLEAAVLEAHQRGVTHGDLGAYNVIGRVREGRLEPVIIDYGIGYVDRGGLYGIDISQAKKLRSDAHVATITSLLSEYAAEGTSPERKAAIANELYAASKDYYAIKEKTEAPQFINEIGRKVESVLESERLVKQQQELKVLREIITQPPEVPVEEVAVGIERPAAPEVPAPAPLVIPLPEVIRRGAQEQLQRERAQAIEEIRQRTARSLEEIIEDYARRDRNAGFETEEQLVDRIAQDELLLDQPPAAGARQVASVAVVGGDAVDVRVVRGREINSHLDAQAHDARDRAHILQALRAPEIDNTLLTALAANKALLDANPPKRPAQAVFTSLDPVSGELTVIAAGTQGQLFIVRDGKIIREIVPEERSPAIGLFGNEQLAPLLKQIVIPVRPGDRVITVHDGTTDVLSRADFERIFRETAGRSEAETAQAIAEAAMRKREQLPEAERDDISVYVRDTPPKPPIEVPLAEARPAEKVPAFSEVQVGQRIQLRVTERGSPTLEDVITRHEQLKATDPRYDPRPVDAMLMLLKIKRVVAEADVIKAMRRGAKPPDRAKLEDFVEYVLRDNPAQPQNPNWARSASRATTKNIEALADWEYAPRQWGTKAVSYVTPEGTIEARFWERTREVHHRDALSTMLENAGRFDDARAIGRFGGERYPESVLRSAAGFQLTYDRETGRITRVEGDSSLTRAQVADQVPLDARVHAEQYAWMLKSIDPALLPARVIVRVHEGLNLDVARFEQALRELTGLDIAVERTKFEASAGAPAPEVLPPPAGAVSHELDALIPKTATRTVQLSAVALIALVLVVLLSQLFIRRRPPVRVMKARDLDDSLAELRQLRARLRKLQ
jgi:tRNA A-37 threonylcarbamoyl transferase component Bud32